MAAVKILGRGKKRTSTRSSTPGSRMPLECSRDGSTKSRRRILALMGPVIESGIDGIQEVADDIKRIAKEVYEGIKQLAKRQARGRLRRDQGKGRGVGVRLGSSATYERQSDRRELDRCRDMVNLIGREFGRMGTLMAKIRDWRKG